MRQLILLCTLLLAGCSAQLNVRELKKQDMEVDGLPFRTRERFVVEIYQKTDNGYVKIGEQVQIMPNPDRVYLLQHLGQAFANSDTKFTARADGTLSAVTLNSESHLADALSSSGDGLKSLAQGYADLKKAQDDALKAREEALKEREKTRLAAIETREQAALDAQAKKDEAMLAEAQLAELDRSAQPSVRLQKEQEVRFKKLEANIAANKANLPRPFPSVAVRR